MTTEQLRQLIESGLDGAEAQVRSPDEVHFEAVVVASAFEGRRTIQRHQMIYSILGDRVGDEIHALSMRTLTPAEWAEVSGGGAGE